VSFGSKSGLLAWTSNRAVRGVSAIGRLPFDRERLPANGACFDIVLVVAVRSDVVANTALGSVPGVRVRCLYIMSGEWYEFTLRVSETSLEGPSCT
jgi:hypothetical protein